MSPERRAEFREIVDSVKFRRDVSHSWIVVNRGRFVVNLGRFVVNRGRFVVNDVWFHRFVRYYVMSRRIWYLVR